MPRPKPKKTSHVSNPAPMHLNTSTLLPHKLYQTVAHDKMKRITHRHVAAFHIRFSIWQ